MVGKCITCCCTWSGNKKTEAQRQRIEAKIHAHHRNLEGARARPHWNQPQLLTTVACFVPADPYAQGPVFDHSNIALGYCCCAEAPMLAENVFVVRNFGQSRGFADCLYLTDSCS